MNEIGNHRNILVVDDNEGNLLLIKKILKNKYLVTSSESAKEALILIQKYRFDLILLDIMMPEIDGFQLCKMIKSNPLTVDIPVIFMTAKTDAESLENAFEIGAIDYITKPFNYRELLAKIKNHLRLINSKELIKKELIERLHAEKKIKEQKITLRSILEYSYDAILTLDDQRNILSANISSVKKFEYSNDDFLKLKFEEIIYSENREFVINEIFQVIEFDKHITVECNIITKNEKLVPVEININAIKIPNKKIILAIIRDITERIENQQKIVSAIFQTEEKERARFAKDIHDGIGSLLSSANIYLNLIISQNLTKAEFENYLIYAKGLIDETITSAREIANNLRPTVLNHLGLVESLKTFIEKINNTKKIVVNFNHKNLENQIEKDIEIIIFRIVNELINNTLKHAKAQNIDIEIDNTTDKISIFYKDNGIGFDVKHVLSDNQKGAGLHNIISRIKSISGTFSIVSEKNKGTIVEIVI